MIVILWGMQSNIFRTHIFLVFGFGATPNHIPLKHRCLIKKSNQIEHAYYSLLKSFDRSRILKDIFCFCLGICSVNDKQISWLYLKRMEANICRVGSGLGHAGLWWFPLLVELSLRVPPSACCGAFLHSFIWQWSVLRLIQKEAYNEDKDLEPFQW